MPTKTHPADRAFRLVRGVLRGVLIMLALIVQCTIVSSDVEFGLHGARRDPDLVDENFCIGPIDLHRPIIGIP